MATVTVMKRYLPRKLEGKVSPGLVWYARQKTFMLSVSIPASVLLLFGPVVGRPDHNGIRYLIGSLLCPWIAALYYLVFPFKPYRGSPFLPSGTHSVDSSGPEVIRLVDLFKSPAAKSLLWRAAIKLSGILLASMAMLTLVVRHSLSWSLPSPWLFPGLMGCTLFCWIAIGTQLVDWGLKTWAATN